MFAKQHLEPWASFAELSTKHGKIIPQRPTIKVNFFFFYWPVFLLEQKCFVGLFLWWKKKRPCAIVLCNIVHNCTQWQIYCILPVCTFSSTALLKLLEVVIPCFVENVRKEHERQVVMGILETMNSVIKSCKETVFTNPAHLKEVSHVIRDVLKKKVSRLTLDWNPDFLGKEISDVAILIKVYQWLKLDHF